MVISASPSLPPSHRSLSLSLPPPSCSFTPSLSFSRPNASLRFSSVLPCPPRARETLFTISLFPCVLSSASVSSFPSSSSSSLAHSLGEVYASRHFSYSVVPSSVLPLRLSPPRPTLFLRCLSLSPVSPLREPSLHLALTRLFARTSTFAPLFPFGLFSVASG